MCRFPRKHLKGHLFRLESSMEEEMYLKDKYQDPRGDARQMAQREGKQEAMKELDASGKSDSFLTFLKIEI